MSTGMKPKPTDHEWPHHEGFSLDDLAAIHDYACPNPALPAGRVTGVALPDGSPAPQVLREMVEATILNLVSFSVTFLEDHIPGHNFSSSSLCAGAHAMSGLASLNAIAALLRGGYRIDHVPEPVWRLADTVARSIPWDNGLPGPLRQVVVPRGSQTARTKAPRRS